MLRLVLWPQEGWEWSPVRTGPALAPEPIMAPVIAIGLHCHHGGLPDGIKTILWAILIDGSGVLIGTSLTIRSARKRWTT